MRRFCQIRRCHSIVGRNTLTRQCEDNRLCADVTFGSQASRSTAEFAGWRGAVRDRVLQRLVCDAMRHQKGVIARYIVQAGVKYGCTAGQEVPETEGFEMIGRRVPEQTRWWNGREKSDLPFFWHCY